MKSLRSATLTLFLYKQHFYKQHLAEIDKKLSKKLNNTLRLNFWQKCPNKQMWLL